MRGSKSLLTWIAGVLVAAVIAVLGVIFMMDIYIALKNPSGRPSNAAEGPLRVALSFPPIPLGAGQFTPKKRMASIMQRT